MNRNELKFHEHQPILRWHVRLLFFIFTSIGIFLLSSNSTNGVLTILYWGVYLLIMIIVFTTTLKININHNKIELFVSILWVNIQTKSIDSSESLVIDSDFKLAEFGGWGLRRSDAGLLSYIFSGKYLVRTSFVNFTLNNVLDFKAALENTDNQ